LLFLRLRWALVRNSWHALVGRSKVRPITVVLCSLVIGLFVFFVSWEGFRFLSQQGLELGGGIVGMLFDLMFLALAGLLVFSSGRRSPSTPSCRCSSSASSSSPAAWGPSSACWWSTTCPSGGSRC